jgi:hypothetical protein
MHLADEQHCQFCWVRGLKDDERFYAGLLPEQPTLAGLLLGFPLVYLVAGGSGQAGADRLSRHLSAARLTRLTLTAALPAALLDALAQPMAGATTAALSAPARAPAARPSLSSSGAQQASRGKALARLRAAEAMDQGDRYTISALTAPSHLLMPMHTHNDDGEGEAGPAIVASVATGGNCNRDFCKGVESAAAVSREPGATHGLVHGGAGCGGGRMSAASLTATVREWHTRTAVALSASGLGWGTLVLGTQAVDPGLAISL